MSEYPTLGDLRAAGDLSKAYLIERNGALYDTEYFASNLDRIRFFERQVGQPTWMPPVRPEWISGKPPVPFNIHSKTWDDTNICNSKTLDYPVEFIVEDIGVFIDDKISEEAREFLISNGNIELVRRSSEFAHGDDFKIKMNLCKFPNRCKEGAIRDTLKKSRENRLSSDLMVTMSDRLRIVPGEEFFVAFSCPFPKMVDINFKITVVLGGKRFSTG